LFQFDFQPVEFLFNSGVCCFLIAVAQPVNLSRDVLPDVIVDSTLVGDIHQPLHAGFAEDRGGNSVEVRFNGRKMNLHSLWDTALVELEGGTPAEIAARIEATVTSGDRQQWQQGTASDWALESLAIVRAQVYRLPASAEISVDYIERALPLIRTRLAQAGARLAWLLNRSFPY
jgi:hypothetical protein